jgi:hypothetical protein
MIAILVVVGALVFLAQPALYGTRDRLLRTWTLMGTAVLVLTETLSLPHALTRPFLFLGWLAVAAVAAFFLWRRGMPKRTETSPPDRRDLSAWVPPAFILFATLVIALAAPPNNWDSMTYHMARVANWAEHASVAHYPTSIVRQLALSPWAEYAILNAQVLAGGSDRWAMLVQWTAFGVCAMTVSLLLREMGYSRRTQYLGAMFVLTMPMALLQSTSTQNDLAAAAWVAAFVYFILHPKRDFLFAALALGLAVNTKGTAVLVAPAFAIGAWLLHRKTVGWGPATLRFVGIAALALVANLPFFARNTATFGSPAGEPKLVRVVNSEVHDPMHMLSNVVRQMSIHWGTPIGRVTWGMEQAVIRAHSAVGLDASDPRTSYTRFHILAPSNHEDEAPNPIHFWLIVAGCIVVLARWRRSPAVGFVIQLCIAFLLFSFVLKWQIWASRLQLPLLVLGGVAAAAGFSSLLPSLRSHRVLVAFLFLASLPWVFLNRSRPLLTFAWDPSGPGYAPGTARSVLVNWLPAKSVLSEDRTSQMFINRKFLEKPYRSALASATSGHCATVGLITKEDSWEYPLHALARAEETPVRFRHLGVLNASRVLPEISPPACSVIVLDDPSVVGKSRTISIDGAPFVQVSQDSLVRVFRPPTQ